MDENIITVDGIDYTVLFMYRDAKDQLLLLLQHGYETYCVQYADHDGTIEFLPVSDEQIEETVAAFNHHLENTIIWDNESYEITAEVSGIVLASLESRPDVLFPFHIEDGAYVPLQLDEAGKLFYKNMYRARLEENHEFLMDAKPVITSPKNALDKARLCSFDDYGVYLYHETDGKPGILFLNEKSHKVVVSPQEQETLLKEFQAWEMEEFKKADSFTIENVK